MQILRWRYNPTLYRQSGVRVRSDILVYTSRPLKQGFEVIGSVTAGLYIFSSLDHTDFLSNFVMFTHSGHCLVEVA